ncbi:MAG: hypothetical protein K0B87_07675 [Candidatus Syntrophosphaera sp.]|nr:hypothetical protein [Candidatus Syntrophosphaera sp.]
MRKAYLLLLIFLMGGAALSAYNGEVHEDIVRQAIEYLNHIHYFDNYSTLANHDAVNALLHHSIAEDHEDWIYGYGQKGGPVPYIEGISEIAINFIKGQCITVTHFWNADMIEPVNSSGHNLVKGKWLGGEFTIHNIPSAQRKAERMIHGSGIRHFRTLEFSTKNKDHSFATVAEPKVPSLTVNLYSTKSKFRIAINSVDDYILGHNVLILGRYGRMGKYSAYEIPYHVHLSDEDWERMMRQTGNCEEYKYLGRLAHLLSDMSVPAHAHADNHGILPVLGAHKYDECDAYEGWNIQSTLKSRGGYLHARSGVKWTSADVARIYGYELIPVPSAADSRDFLYDLFYCVNQVAAMFPSNDCDGDFNANPEHPFSEYPFILEMQARILEMHGGSTDFQKHRGKDFTEEELDKIQYICMPMAIRAVATLLHWWGCRYGYERAELRHSD